MSFVGLIIGIAVVRLAERTISVGEFTARSTLPILWIAVIALWLPYYWYTLAAYPGASAWFSGSLWRFFVALVMPIVFIVVSEVPLSSLQSDDPASGFVQARLGFFLPIVVLFLAMAVFEHWRSGHRVPEPVTACRYLAVGVAVAACVCRSQPAQLGLAALSLIGSGAFMWAESTKRLMAWS